MLQSCCVGNLAFDKYTSYRHLVCLMQKKTTTSIIHDKSYSCYQQHVVALSWQLCLTYLNFVHDECIVLPLGV